jgi:hypothetical protein
MAVLLLGYKAIEETRYLLLLPVHPPAEKVSIFYNPSGITGNWRITPEADWTGKLLQARPLLCYWL